MLLSLFFVTVPPSHSPYSPFHYKHHLSVFFTGNTRVLLLLRPSPYLTILSLHPPPPSSPALHYTVTITIIFFNIFTVNTRLFILLKPSPYLTVLLSLYTIPMSPSSITVSPHPPLHHKHHHTIFFKDSTRVLFLLKPSTLSHCTPVTIHHLPITSPSPPHHHTLLFHHILITIPSAQVTHDFCYC